MYIWAKDDTTACIKAVKCGFAANWRQVYIKYRSPEFLGLRYYYLALREYGAVCADAD